MMIACSDKSSKSKSVGSPVNNIVLGNNNEKLTPIREIKSYLVYEKWNFQGAMEHPFLNGTVAEKLKIAQNKLVEISKTCDKKIELLVLDAYRKPETQAAIFNKYVETLLIGDPALNREMAEIKAMEYVNPPSIIFPHGTGGAVDVTLLMDNKLAEMGTKFDAFTAKAAADYFRRNLPNSEIEIIASGNREILREAMEHAGFVVLDAEWWHFEYGTHYWSIKTNEKVIFNRILFPPTIESPATVDRIVPRHQPVLETGVAQLFPSRCDRAASLAHEKPGHYYARNSQPTLENLEKYLKSHIFGCKYAKLFPAGLTACVSTIRALVPTNGCIVYDEKIYYETQRRILYWGKKLGWEMIKKDFKLLKNIENFLCNSKRKIDLLYFDNPRNWYLDNFDIDSIVCIAKENQTLLAVDSSVQPIQNTLKSGADVEIVSLSKYPSQGLTLGGVVVSNNSCLMEKIRNDTEDGITMSPETAYIIHAMATSLHDRIAAISDKTEKVAAFLKNHKAVKKVRLPDKKFLGGYIGGQITFHLQNPNHGIIIENIVGNNSLKNKWSLQLGCTFGASYTTIEHFVSNQRKRSEIPREETNEIEIPDDLIRLGIGNERVEDIINDLDFLLNMVISSSFL